MAEPVARYGNRDEASLSLMTPPVTKKALLKATIDPGKAISNVEIQEVTMRPKQKTPLHLHPFPTVGIITEGTIAFHLAK
jgi:quercetin dioxygenase-like cupin family protein